MADSTDLGSATVIEPIDLENDGLNLNSTTSNFAVEFAPTPSFDKGVVKLTKDWKDDMGLHLLQRNMLPQRILRCLITLNGVLKLSESYESAIRRSVNVNLSDLVIDTAYEVDQDFILQLSLAGPNKTFVLQELFEPTKFKLGGVAKREVEARGFQLAEVKDNKYIITSCKHIRLTVKEWRKINDSADFSPKIVHFIKSAGKRKDIQDLPLTSSGPLPKSNDEQDVKIDTPSEVTLNSRRPCSCWTPNDGTAAEEQAVKHSDVCDSYWAALFKDYAESTRTKKAPAGGLGTSRWAGRQ